MNKKQPDTITTGNRLKIINNEKGQELTTREIEVISHLKQGKKYAEIAAVLFISTETLKRHASNIYAKLKVENRTQAINKYFGNG